MRGGAESAADDGNVTNEVGTGKKEGGCSWSKWLPGLVSC